jgi:hypothetical protein
MEVALEKDGDGAGDVAVTSSGRVAHHPIRHCPGSGYALSAILGMALVRGGSGRRRMPPRVMFRAQLEHRDLSPWRQEPPELDEGRIPFRQSDQRDEVEEREFCVRARHPRKRIVRRSVYVFPVRESPHTGGRGRSVGRSWAGRPKPPRMSSSLPESSSSKAFSRSPKSKSPGVSEREGGKFCADELKPLPTSDDDVNSSRSNKDFPRDEGAGLAPPAGLALDIKSSSPQSSVDGFGGDGSRCAELAEEPKSQSSSFRDNLDLGGCEDENEAVSARESSPAQAFVLCEGGTGC